MSYTQRDTEFRRSCRLTNGRNSPGVLAECGGNFSSLCPLDSIGTSLPVRGGDVMMCRGAALTKLHYGNGAIATALNRFGRRRQRRRQRRCSTNKQPETFAHTLIKHTPGCGRRWWLAGERKRHGERELFEKFSPTLVAQIITEDNAHENATRDCVFVCVHIVNTFEVLIIPGPECLHANACMLANWAQTFARVAFFGAGAHFARTVNSEAYYSFVFNNPVHYSIVRMRIRRSQTFFC